ncbi:MAG: hypothetical protein IPO83_04695 [Chitinophagaceae bacterium]|nr:hypothetical protein [Chitinophagaceae bacterium]
MTNRMQFSLQHKSSSLVLLILLMIMVIAWCFGPMVLHPNDYYLSAGGDGIRNYYAVAYYAKYDGGLHFTGMNYPYGEHVMYTDNQFPLAFAMSIIQSTLFNISAYTVGIINYVMFISLILSAVFLYLLLYELKVKSWFAIPAAIAITIVSPQLQRMGGHYSLAYVFFTPLLLYLLFHLQQSKRKVKWTLVLSAVIIFFGLTHLYYLAMAGAFILCYVMVSVNFEFFSNKKISDQSIWPLATVLIAFVFIEGIIFLTDPVTDRIKIPYGFFQSYATSESVFNPPSWSYLKNLGFTKIISQTSQGYAYVGITVDIAISLCSLLLLLFIFHRPTFRKIIPGIPGFLIIAVIASIPVLLFSMCLPWRWNMMELLNQFSFIRQFRALDRFAYVFIM